jgi:endonuclease/exonuclease/phosphatase (EEP) superfamily protein YafD
MGGVRRVAAEAFAVFLTANAGACALAAVLAQGGRWSPRLDILTHFALIYLFAAGAAVALALFLRNWGRPTVLALSGVAAAASLALVLPEFLRPEGPKAPADASGQIKVIQLNALRTNTEIGRIADWLIVQDPDIVTITEARPDLRDLIKRRTGWQVAGAAGSLMIFSQERRITMDRPHLPKDARMSYVNATYPSASGPYEVVTAHICWPTGRNHQAQHRQLRRLIAALPHDRLILAGDLNSAPWSFALRRTERGLGLTRRDKGMPTFPADRRGFWWPYPVLPIDHVYAGPGWATVKVERGPRLGSDHYPVIVTLAPVGPR